MFRCEECESAPATAQCLECDENFCNACWGKVHNKAKRATHARTLLPITESPPTPAAAPPAELPSEVGHVAGSSHEGLGGEMPCGTGGGPAADPLAGADGVARVPQPVPTTIADKAAAGAEGGGPAAPGDGAAPAAAAAAAAAIAVFTPNAWDAAARTGDGKAYVQLQPMPEEDRIHEYKSIYAINRRCPDFAVHKMKGYLVKFASACINSSLDGTMVFGVMEGKEEAEVVALAAAVGTAVVPVTAADLHDRMPLACGFELGVDDPGDTGVRQKLLGTLKDAWVLTEPDGTGGAGAPFVQCPSATYMTNRVAEPIFVKVVREDGTDTGRWVSSQNKCHTVLSAGPLPMLM